MRYILFSIISLFCIGKVNAENIKSYLRVVPPLNIEVTFDKTVHVIFPSKIKYVDLGSGYVIAGNTDETQNIIRIKAAVRNFMEETNLSVVCENGSFYNFNVRYADDPVILNLIVTDENQNVDGTILLKELKTENPILVEKNLKLIADKQLKPVCHLTSKSQKMRFSVNGLFIQGNILYASLEIENQSHIPFDIDMIDYTIRDRKKAKRKAIQTKSIRPIRVYGNNKNIPGQSKTAFVIALSKLTFNSNKTLELKLVERDGERHQKIQIKNKDLISAKLITE